MDSEKRKKETNLMVRPKKLGEVQSLTNSAQNKDYFSTKYSLKAKAGGSEGLMIGQEIYCLPLVKDGVCELWTHTVKARGKNGFKSQYNVYIPCKGFNEETGDYDGNCTCCQLAQQEWDKFVANGKKGETIISFKSQRYYIPVMLLGNDTGTKAPGQIPVSKLTLSGRDFSYIELSSKAFKDLITALKNDLLNNGRMEYGLEGDALLNELMEQLQKHILKISIDKSDGFGKHKKNYSFVSFTNKNIGAETGSYKNITEGLAKSAKLQAEAQEFLTLFYNELDSVLVPWTDIELGNYVNNITSSSTNTEMEEKVAQSGVAPKATESPVPKSEQVVITEDVPVEESDEFFDGEDVSDIKLEETESANVAPNNDIDLSDEDMSFSMGEEDFFGDE